METGRRGLGEGGARGGAGTEKSGLGTLRAPAGVFGGR